MKIAVAMSGGVDSSVAAKILVSEGHQVIGLFLKLWTDPTLPDGLRGTSPKCIVQKDNRCCDYQALEDARKVAGSLNIPFYVINAKEAFKEKVVDNFLDEYQKLRTPNPCIVCNEKIKFDLLLKKALDLDCDKLATGHYARIIEDNSRSSNSKTQGSINYQIPNSKYKLLCGLDQQKDQSYMLYRLTQDKLSKILFPLGGMTKKEVRALAKKWNLSVQEKPESQEICFVNDDYRSFLKRYLPKSFKAGEIVDQTGKTIGTHRGLINYTIGQRKGVEQNQIAKIKYQNNEVKSKNPDRVPLYVVGFNTRENQLIVGEDKETYQKEMSVGDLSWVSQDALNKISDKIKVKIRYRHDAVPCKIVNKELGIKKKSKSTEQQFNNLTIEFREFQRAITPGQSAVFYLGDQVIGGGVIIK